ncbi:MAG TPA: peptidylprolyl isomerase [Gemmatimonadaceae bacterium]
MLKARLAAIAALVSLTACEGLKEAMTAHVDVVARAEKQELSVQRLADLMGGSQVPLAKPVAEQIAQVWVSYQLLGKAAAVGDSLVDSELIDKVMWPVYAQSKTQKWMGMVRERLAIDTSNLEAAYNAGDHLLAAQHILFSVPEGQQATGSDSVMRRAEAVRRQATSQNFAALAKQHSGDPSNKDTGGDLGVFLVQQMVADFSAGVKATKPGEIGPLVRTQFGYHIVRRKTYAEAREQFNTQYSQLLRQSAESTYFAGLTTARKVEVKPNAAKVVKEVAADLDANKGNRTAIASSTDGNFTAGDVARWLGSMQQRDRMRDQIQQAPDSVLPNFVKSLMLNEMLLKQADSAGVKIDTAEVNAVRSAFKSIVKNTWAGLRVSPELLSDSAKTPAEKERLAAARVDGYLGRLLLQQEGYIDVPPPLAEALREKYDGSVKPAGITRAVEIATKTRAAADSARAASQPKSAIPMPDTGRGGGAGATKR